MILPVASTPKSAVMSASSISARVASSSFRKAEKIFLSGAVKTSLVFASPCLNFSRKPPKSPMVADYSQEAGIGKQETEESHPHPIPPLRGGRLLLLLARRGRAQADVVQDAVDE